MHGRQSHLAPGSKGPLDWSGKVAQYSSLLLVWPRGGRSGWPQSLQLAGLQPLAAVRS